MLKKETEDIILVSQEQALPTNCMKVKIHHVRKNGGCNVCSDKDETTGHLISICSKISQAEFKQSYDQAATIFHWKHCQRFGFKCSKSHWKMGRLRSSGIFKIHIGRHM